MRDDELDSLVAQIKDGKLSFHCIIKEPHAKPFAEEADREERSGAQQVRVMVRKYYEMLPEIERLAKLEGEYRKLLEENLKLRQLAAVGSSQTPVDLRSKTSKVDLRETAG